jgi:NADH-quinone oxidoreductase subunit L
MDRLLDLAPLFLPLLGGLLAGLLGPRLGERFACWATCLGTVLGALAGGLLFYDVAFLDQARIVFVAHWIETPAFAVNWALKYDALSTLMIAVVGAVSALVHIYAVGYMKGDRGRVRFMALLSFFTFFMLTLASADNLAVLFFGWEGVGVLSYLLIGFWYERPQAAAAGIKAFVMNRIGDVGFLIGLFLTAHLFGTLRFTTIFRQIPDAAPATIAFGNVVVPALPIIAGCFALGAIAKSAQAGLHTWLPDAMEGPTPVSALIHAATMVTAGVFLIARLSPLYEAVPQVRLALGCLGAATALLAAMAAVVQTDIKRVIAYSTMSQLGFMFMALGASAYGAAMFHLATHAFFKALLFLGAGSVIHALNGEQDLRNMGGLARRLPITYGVMLIGAAALAGLGIDGVFGLAGFYSKDLILESVAGLQGAGPVLFGIGLVAAGLTAFYALRLILLAFHGHTPNEKAHEAPVLLWGPMIPLAIGAVFAGFWAEGWIATPLFWKRALVVVEAGAGVAAWERWAPVGMALVGGGVAWLFYAARPHWPLCVLARFGAIVQIVKGGFGVDWLYTVLFVRPVEKIARVLAQVGDDKVLDTLGPDGLGSLAVRWGRAVTALQVGAIYTYALVLIGGLGALVFVFCLMP